MSNQNQTTESPVRANTRNGIFRICCGKIHSGTQCPDGLVMCCLCFERKTLDQLSVDPESGKRSNVCAKCEAVEKQAEPALTDEQYIAEVRRLLVEKYEFLPSIAPHYGNDQYWIAHKNRGVNPDEAIRQDIATEEEQGREGVEE